MTESSIQKQEGLLLITAIGNGDQQALGKLYDKYAPVLAGIISRIVKSESQCEEVLQKVFQQVWSEAGSFDSSRNFPFTWLLKITRQLAIESLRSTAPPNASPTYAAATATTFEGPIEQHIFEQLCFKGFHYSEVASTLNMPADTIKKYLRKAIINFGQTV